MTRQAITRRDLLDVLLGLLLCAAFAGAIWVAWSIPYLLESAPAPSPTSNTRPSVSDAQRLTGR